jgi:hypothetical protein
MLTFFCAVHQLSKGDCGHGKLIGLQRFQPFQYTGWFTLDNINTNVSIQHENQSGSLS